LAKIWELVNKSNKYIEDMAPWSLAKSPETKARLGTVMYNLAEVIRIVAVLCTPYMPTLPNKIYQQLGISDNKEVHCWDSAKKWGNIPYGVEINRGEPIFPRIQPEEREIVQEKADNKPKQEPKEEAANLIDISEFAKVELKIAEITAADKVEKADKLLKLKVSLGIEERTVVAGIAKHYEPDELVGKKVVLVTNLKPVTLRGITSQGMILAASKGKKLSLVTVEKDVPVGSKVK